jgi:DNA polymerase III alpha subunit
MSTNYKNSINELTQGVLNHGPEVLTNCVVDDIQSLQSYLDKIALEHLDYPIPKTTFDKDNWFIPTEYKDFDIENWVLCRCSDIAEYSRVEEELKLFHKNGMIPVLKTMKYVVDTLRSQKVVWGVGRGSSVASYVLYLIGVHKVDSIKYNLPIEEFFKGDQNG